MAQSLLITLREGLEAALIIGIVLAYLKRIGRGDRFPAVWWVVAGAAGLSLVGGAILFSVGVALEGAAEELFEGAAMFLAVAVLSWMVIWMKRQAVDIKASLQRQIQTAVATGSGTALVALAFFTVGREGLETSLFLFTAFKTSTTLQTLVGAIVGLSIAVVVGWSIYRGSRFLNLRLFFDISGVLVVLFAAGLLARGIHEFQEAGALPMVVEHVWDINSALNEKAGLGAFLKGLFGYNGNPSLLEVVIYPAFLAMALFYFFRRPAPTLAAPAQQRAT